jgi:glutamyl-tRNA reductase
MVGIIGISHQTALLEVREQLVISKEEVPGLYEYLNQQCHVIGVLALSTCNRTELYFETHQHNDSEEAAFMNRITEAYIAYFKKDESIKKHLYRYRGLDCARHLFKVATGLDSLILGEYQIVSQIKEAFSWVENTAMIGPELTRMVHKAFEAGKQVRTQTAISRGAVSVSSAAVEMAGKKLGCLKHVKTLTIGAGETGSIVALNFSKRGCTENWISNRTNDKAEQLAKRINGKAIAFDQCTDQLTKVDIAIYATGSQRALLTRAEAETMMAKRNHQPLMVMDLCNPRNVDPEVGTIEGITLFDLDHMEEVVKANFNKRKKILTEADVIINKVVEEFDDWLNMRRMRSAINQITSTFQDIHKAEALNYKKQDDDDSIKAYGDHLSAKFTRMMIKQIRQITNEGRDPEKVKIIEEFFNFSS